MVESDRIYRYERKFLVEGLERGQVRDVVRRHPAMFREQYPPRWVNNLYLDTEDLALYNANINGAAERCKVRLRWYGDVFGTLTSPVLEFKIRNGHVGTKQSYPFPSFTLGPGFSCGLFQELARGASLPAHVHHHLRTLNVVLCNSYKRWYHVSRDGLCRLTIDASMLYYRLQHFNNNFIRPVRDDYRIIVELKYDRSLEPRVNRIASVFPFRMTRNSKYVTGMEVVSDP